MAQSKQKRRRKHRGTPAGTIDRAGRTGSSRTRQDAKSISRDRRAARMNRPPTWRNAVNRAAIAALIFGVLLVVLGRSLPQVAIVVPFVFAIYIPLGYYTDTAIYRFRQRRQAAGK